MAAHATPQSFHRPCGKAFRVSVGHRPCFFGTGGRVATVEADARRVGKISLQGRPVVAAIAIAVAERHAGLHVHTRQNRLKLHLGRANAAVGHKGHADRLEAEQQRVGRDVVRAQWLAVKAAGVGVGQLKGAAVEHDVAGNLAHTQPLHPAQQQPQPLGHQLGVAQAPDVQVAVKGAIAHRAFNIDRGAPAEGGPEQIERGVGGDQLHHRGRVDRHAGAVAQPRRLPAFGIHHQQRHGIARQVGAQ